MKDFFISYNSADRQWAEWIAWQLEQAGYTTVIQAWDSQAGNNFIEWMDKASKNTKQTIAILSPSYLKGKFSKDELTAALYKEKLLPILIQDFDVEGLLGPISYIDLVGLDEEEARDKLRKDVKQGRKKPTVQPSFPGTIKRTIKNQPAYPGFKSKGLNEIHPLYEKDEDITIINNQKYKNFGVKLLIPGKEKIKILFIGVQITASAKIDLESELQKIYNFIRKSIFSNRMIFHKIFDIRAVDLLKVLQEHSPTILHLSCAGPIFPLSQEGGVRILKEVDLVSILREFKNDLKLVILNFSQSLSYAKSVTKFIDFAIGVNGDLADNAAIMFSGEFYRALCAGRSIESAFNLAKIATRLIYEKDLNGKMPDGKIKKEYKFNDYELRWRQGIDPSNVVLFKIARLSKVREILKRLVR